MDGVKQQQQQRGDSVLRWVRCDIEWVLWTTTEGVRMGDDGGEVCEDRVVILVELAVYNVRRVRLVMRGRTVE